MPVSAAPGGTYRIEEGVGMTLEIPQDWVVFSRDASPSDPDVEGYGGYDVMMKDLQDGEIYLSAIKDGQGFVMLQIMSDIEEFAQIDNLTEEYIRASEAEKKEFIEEIQNSTGNTGGTFTGLHYSDDVNKVNNYLYIGFMFNVYGSEMEAQVTVINGKFVMFSSIPTGGGALTDTEKASFYQILSTVRYDNQLTAEEVMASEEESKTNGTMILFVVLGIVLLAVIVIVLVLVRKKKQTPPPASGGYVPPVQTPPTSGGYVPPVQTPSAPSIEPEATSNAPEGVAQQPPSVEAVQEPAGQGVQSAPQSGGSVFCRMCGAELEADSEFCTKCGVSVE